MEIVQVQRDKLESIIPTLERDGCRYVGLFIPELDEGQQPYYFLHVEKEEIHSPTSLFERNSQFYALADLHALDSYDGMDVGPIQPR
ncbi:MAG: ribonuclease E inhibitor RraB [Betaproteobacteria bacterium]|nr:MAG: ribonuclease E inhibitor RraB [Betaproteobacteria bacterium]